MTGHASYASAAAPYYRDREGGEEGSLTQEVADELGVDASALREIDRDAADLIRRLGLVHDELLASQFRWRQLRLSKGVGCPEAQFADAISATNSVIHETLAPLRQMIAKGV